MDGWNIFLLVLGIASIPLLCCIIFLLYVICCIPRINPTPPPIVPDNQHGKYVNFIKAKESVKKRDV